MKEVAGDFDAVSLAGLAGSTCRDQHHACRCDSERSPPGWLPDVADEDGWQRLGRRIRSERSRRWPVRADFAAECGIGDRTIAAIENAERHNFKATTIEAVELALGWEYGSAERVRNRMQPKYIVELDPDFVALRNIWPSLPVAARRMVVEIAKRAVE